MNPTPIKNKQLPLYIMLVVSLALAGIFFRLQQASTASANSGDIQLAESTYANIVGSRIDSCTLCHTSSIPSLNPFGAAYKAQGRGVASSLRAIESVDSDGDGFSNLQELTALTFPGDSADHPAAPTATNTPFQPATPTRTATLPAATATNTQAASTATNTRAAAATQTRTATGAATASVTRTPAATSVAPSAVPSAMATLRASRTPTVKATLKPTKVPTCISGKGGDDDDDDKRRANRNCSHRPDKDNKSHSDSDDRGSKEHDD